MLRTSLAVLIAILGSGIGLGAQAPKAFDVASVKPIDPMMSYGCGDAGVEYPAGGGFRTVIPTGRPNPPIGGLPLACLVAIAYDVAALEVVGGPGWVWTDLFAIDARSEPATRSDTKGLLRTLLAERFGLIVRQEPSGSSRQISQRHTG